MSAKGFDRYHQMRKSSRVFRDGFRRRSETVLGYLRRGLGTPSPEQLRLLDVGTADGIMLHVFADAFPGARLVGLEANEELAEVAREQGLEIACARAEALPFDDASFDAVTIVATLKHIPEADAALAECHRVLASGGHVIVADPTPMGLRLGLWRGHFDRKWLANMWTLAETRVRLERAGFEVVDGVRYMPLPIDFFGTRALEKVMRWTGLSRLFMQQATLARKP